jgi:hypothetical protein
MYRDSCPTYLYTINNKLAIDILKAIVALVLIALCIRHRKAIKKVTIENSKKVVKWLENE